jgi:hypothetical protein
MTPLCPPATLPVRLEIIEALTGVPASTLREAVRRGIMNGRYAGKAIVATLDDYARYIEAQGKRGRVLQDHAERDGSPGQDCERQADKRTVQADEAGSAAGVQHQVKKRKRRRRQPTIVYDISAEMAE